MKKSFEDTVCPACGIIDRFGDKWSLRILVFLYQEGTQRFGEIFRKIPGISQKVLTEKLRILESDKLIARTVYAEVPPRVEYTLTPLGQSLIPALDSIINWAIEHSEEMKKLTIYNLR